MKTIIKILVLLSVMSFCFYKCGAQGHDTALVLTKEEALDYFMRGYKPRSFISPVTKKEVWVLDVYYMVSGTFTPIQKQQPFDSVKYWRERFLFFTDRMNNSTGKAFARFEDSAKHYYKLLYRKNK